MVAMCEFLGVENDGFLGVKIQRTLATAREVLAKEGGV